MSTGELIAKIEKFANKNCYQTSQSSKANIIAEKIGMPGLFEIR